MQHAEQKQRRLLSLDAFRGLTIAAMVLVNNPGTWDYVYAPLLHKPWDGLTPTDLVFPFFIFMVGVSIAFAFQKRKDAGEPVSKMRNKVIFRALKIYIVGMILYAIMHWPITSFSEVRYLGVLHRISLVFFVCGLLFLYTKPKTQILLCVLFLLLYHCCMTMIPMPEGRGIRLEPGDNISALVDSKILPGHPYWGPWNDHGDWDDTNPYMKSWDPEGLFSTIPAFSSGLIGILAGLLLLGPKTKERKTIILFFAGFLMLIAGYFWGQSFPVNKSLWSSSYVLVSSGFACMGLAACYYYMDILGRTKLLHFAVVFGCNAIAIYCLADLLTLVFYTDWGTRFPQAGSFAQFLSPGLNTQFIDWMTTCHGCSQKLASLLYGLFFVFVNFIPAYVLYKFKIYIRL